MDDLIGTSLGQYQLQSVIRHGGMSTVFRAFQASLDRHVAVKVLAQTRDPAFVARFQREARAIAQLQHPNILPVYDYGEQDGLLYLVMQYVGEGATLADQLKGAMEPGPALRVTSLVLEALEYAHNLGIVHRDVKPQNILMPSPKWPLLADFGIAKLLNDTAGERLTGHGFVVGTAAYMAPEQAHGQAVDAQTDLYSTGIVLYEMVTGQVPFDAETPVSILAKHAFEQPRPPRQIRPHVPAEVERVIMRALEKERSARYRTAVEMAADVNSVAERLGAPTPPPQPPATPPPPPFTPPHIPAAAAGHATEATTALYEAAVRDYTNGHFDTAIVRLESVLAIRPEHEAAADLLRAARWRIGEGPPARPGTGDRPPGEPADDRAVGGRRRGGLIAALVAGVVVLVGGTIAAFRLVDDRPSGSTLGAGASGTGSAPGTETTAAAPVTTLVTTTVPVEPAADAGTLRFADHGAVMDQVTLVIGGLEDPGNGSQYEAWLTGEDGESRISLGVVSLDEEGMGRLEFVDPDGANLLAAFDAVEVTAEPDPDPNTLPNGDVVAEAALATDALVHVRHLLGGFDTTPENVGLAVGLLRQARVVDQHARALVDSHEADDAARVTRIAEALVNMLEGPEGEHYGDLDEDGTLTDNGDGFGLLLNGNNLGYIQGTLDHARLAAEAPDAGPAVQVHAEHVMLVAENASGWAVELNEVVLRIATGESEDLEADIREAVALSDRLLNGTDIDGNEVVDPIPGEGGAITANDHAHYMADIAIPPQ